MIRSEFATLIDRPLPVVFAYVADFSTLPTYDPWVVAAERTSDGPIGVGSTWTHDRVQGRRRITAPIRVTDYVQGERIAMASGSKGFDVTSTMTFSAEGDGTRFSEVLEMRLSGLVRLFEPMIRRQVPGQGADVHERLKALLEAQRAL